LAARPQWNQTPTTYPSTRNNRFIRALCATNRKSGIVIVEFTVDADGFTTDQMVVKSTSREFEAGSIAAVKKFRYAPRFVNGIATSTAGVKNVVIYGNPDSELLVNY
jgi:TonB family protein